MDDGQYGESKTPRSRVYSTNHDTDAETEDNTANELFAVAKLLKQAHARVSNLKSDEWSDLAEAIDSLVQDAEAGAAGLVATMDSIADRDKY
jgi:hypothetical protein